MRLGERARVGGRKMLKTPEMAGLNQEPIRFFDIKTQLPPEVRQSISEELDKPLKGEDEYTLALYGELAAVGLSSFRVSKRDLRDALGAVYSSYREYFEDDDGGIGADPEIDEQFLTVVQLSSLLDTLPARLEKSFQKMKPRFSPDLMARVSPTENSISSLFIGFRLYPEFRSEYQKIVARRLPEYLQVAKQLRSKESVLRSLAFLSILNPEATPVCRELARPSRDEWVADLMNDFDHTEFFPLLSLVMLDNPNTKIDERGRLVFPAVHGSLGTPQPLPERQTL